MTRHVEIWFIAYWLCVGLVVLMFLTGCELPKEGQNYNPTRPYYWTEPSMWLP